MTLIAIVLATLVAGVGSVLIANLILRVGIGTRASNVPLHLLSLAAGALLATAFLHLLPEAFESRAASQNLFVVLLLGIVVFFALDKAELWHHGHEHSHVHAIPPEHGHGGGSPCDAAGPHDHDHATPAGAKETSCNPAAGVWSILTGDSVHCFGDGILIASAFIANVPLGFLAALAVLAHEVPHHIGDLVVVRNAQANRKQALVKVSIAGAMTVLGGVVGFLLLGMVQVLLPYFLVLASSSFIYVALADLIPQLQKRMPTRQVLAQILWLLLGISVVAAMSWISHAGHHHEDSLSPVHEHLHHGHVGGAKPPFATPIRKL